MTLTIKCEEIMKNKKGFFIRVFTLMMWITTLMSLSDSYAVCSGIGC